MKQLRGKRAERQAQEAPTNPKPRPTAQRLNYETLFSQDFPFEILGTSSTRDNVVKRTLRRGATPREPLGENSTEKEEGRAAPCHRKTPGNSLRIPENQLPFNVREGDRPSLRGSEWTTRKETNPFQEEYRSFPGDQELH